MSGQAIGKGETTISVSAWVDGHTRVALGESLPDSDHWCVWVEVGSGMNRVSIHCNADGAARLIAVLQTLREECEARDNDGLDMAAASALEARRNDDSPF